MPISYKRTILITGSTDGIGKQTALDLAQHPDNFVIVHGRSSDKCRATVDQIVRESGNPDNVDFIVADLSNLKEVCRMSDELHMRFPPLNVLVCNAGVLQPRRHETKDGFEVTLQVNYLSHFVLCNRLLPLLEKNTPSRVVVVGSVLHSWYVEWAETNNALQILV